MNSGGRGGRGAIPGEDVASLPVGRSFGKSREQGAKEATALRNLVGDNRAFEYSSGGSARTHIGRPISRENMPRREQIAPLRFRS